ncbi:MAG: hypothetical protein AAB370_04255, partial [Verrucomicrobiota bacterium]
MKKALIVFLIGIVVVVAIIRAVWSSQSASARRALTEYKAKLKAQGEKLTWAEHGYPRAAESNDCLLRLVSAAGVLASRNFSPGLLRLMDLSSAPNLQPCWAKDRLFLSDKNRPDLSWDEFQIEMESVSVALANIRSALSNPPGYVVTDPTNLIHRPKFYVVEQRNVAQWLSADTIYALRRQDLERVCENLWALQQLVHLHQDDPTLVSQMIRVAITGLALSDTWEALQGPGWSESGLVELQQGWERINL